MKKLSWFLVVWLSLPAVALEVDRRETSSPIDLAVGCEKSVITYLYGTEELQLTNRLEANGQGIVSSLSSVQILTRPGVVIDGNFSQPSNYTPNAGSYWVAWQNGKTKLRLDSLKPEDRDQILGRLVYKTRTVPRGEGVIPEVELVSAGVNFNDLLKVQQVSHGQNTMSFAPSQAREYLACQYIKARWCGDGVVDANKGELCDLGVMNGQSGQSCSASCQQR